MLVKLGSKDLSPSEREEMIEILIGMGFRTRGNFFTISHPAWWTDNSLILSGDNREVSHSIKTDGFPTDLFSILNQGVCKC